MKKLLPFLAAIPALGSAEPADDYVNFIRQIQRDSGVEWDVTVPSEGKKISPTGVSFEGAFFQLWSIHKETVFEYLLDEQFVTAYTPNARIEIVTGDPYGPVRRTRVDQPFRVRIGVVGLLDPSHPAYPFAPDAAKWVNYSHVGFNYPDGVHSLAGLENPVGGLLHEGYMEENGDTSVTFNASNLTGADLTRVEGEEVFTISAQADYGVSATILDSQKVQIWPVATGTLSGYDPNRYYAKVPPIQVSLTDLYPDSKTYVRFYRGGPTRNPVGAKKVSASYVIIEDSIPQDRALVLRDLDPWLTKHGEHTLEILHETPFGTEILFSGPIRVDRTIEVTGSLYGTD